MVMRARNSRWNIPADLKPPFGATSGVEGPTIGAFEGPVYVEGKGDPGWLRVPLTIDETKIIAAPASGSTTTLVELARLSTSYRVVIDGFCPYLEGAGGPITQARIPSTGGAAITWRLLVNNVPARPFDAVTTILQPWGQVSPRPLLEIPPGAVVSVVCTNIDPAGAYPYLGVRLMGRCLPLDREDRR